MQSTITTGVFERGGRDELSESQFYTALTLSLIWGLAATAIVAYKMIEIGYKPGLMEVILLGLVVPIAGIFIAVKSDNPFISFVGYNMIVVPFGIILAPVVNQYSSDVVRNAFGMTAGITFFMGFAGTCFPSIFRNMGGPLFLALAGLVIFRIAEIFVPALRGLGFVDYIAAAIFSLYIGYDMYRASEVSRTIDNAIDISVDLYLDIINLFLTLLRIMGSKKD